MRLGIFGGTFDPPHVGHLLAASDAVEHLSLNRLVFVPAAVQPLKVGRPSAAPAAHRLAMVRLMMGEAMRRPEIAEIFGNVVIKRVLGFLKSYMARQVELGRLRPHDVRSSARAFIGMLLPQAGGKLFFPAIREDGLTDEEHVQNATRIFLEGLRPEG